MDRSEKVRLMEHHRDEAERLLEVGKRASWTQQSTARATEATAHAALALFYLNDLNA